MPPTWDGELDKERSRRVEGGPNRKPHHINYLKLLAAFLVLCQAQQLDNYVNKIDGSDMHQKARGTHSQPLFQLAMTIWNWCIWRNVFLATNTYQGKTI